MLRRGIGDVSHTYIYAVPPVSFPNGLFPLLPLPPFILPSSITSHPPAFVQLAMEEGASASDVEILKAISRKERAMRRQAKQDAEEQSLHQDTSGKLFMSNKVKTHLVIVPRRAKIVAMTTGGHRNL